MFIITIAIFSSRITINKKPSCTISITNRQTNTCQNKSNFIETHGIFHLISTNMFTSICSSKNICLKVITWRLVLSRRDLLPPTFYFVHNWKELTRFGQIYFVLIEVVKKKSIKWNWSKFISIEWNWSKIPVSVY